MTVHKEGKGCKKGRKEEWKIGIRKDAKNEDINRYIIVDQ
jgi:hypothetical protein